MLTEVRDFASIEKNHLLSGSRRATDVVLNRGGRNKPWMMARAVCASAQVSIFCVHKEACVEAAEFCPHVSPNDKRTATDHGHLSR